MPFFSHLKWYLSNISILLKKPSHHGFGPRSTLQSGPAGFLGADRAILPAIAAPHGRTPRSTVLRRCNAVTDAYYTFLATADRDLFHVIRSRLTNMCMSPFAEADNHVRQHGCYAYMSLVYATCRALSSPYRLAMVAGANLG